MMMWTALVYLVPLLAAAVPGGALRALRSPAGYTVDSTVLLNEAARKDGEISYKVRADLRVMPVWSSDLEDEYFLKFELLSPELWARGKHINAEYQRVASVWEDYSHSSFFAHFSSGQVQQAYLDTSSHIDVQNFKRSLISLFQFKVLEGASNETDVSGECIVDYETLSETTIRKIKRECRVAAWGAVDEAEVVSRRLTRYSLSAERDVLEEVHAEEMHTLGTVAAGAGLKARTWMRLSRSSTPPTTPTSPTLAAAVQALPRALQPAPLWAAPPRDLHNASALGSNVAASGAELGALAVAASGAEAGAGGGLPAARAALALADALERADPAVLQGLLHDNADLDQLSGLCAALGLAGTERAHRAAATFLRLRQRDAPHHLARLYLDALAQAPHAQDSVVEDILKLGEQLADAALAESALLAAAGAAARATPAAQRSVRDVLARGLVRCSDDECRRVRLAALGNLRCADCAAVLLQHVEGGVAGTALDALDALLTARGSLPANATARLERVVLGASGAALDTRAAALDLLLRAAAPTPLWLTRVLLWLRAEGTADAAELQRLAWGRLRALAPQYESVRLLLRLLPPALRGWDAHALLGTSSLLQREAARGAGWRALLESRQTARGALLRHGRVRLLSQSPDGSTDETITVELWTRGLQALAGGAADDEEEEVAGGLALVVGGARLHATELFRGQAALLGHVWAGTGSSPTPVLRALRPLPEVRAGLPLLGGAALRYRRRALFAAALDADAQVSLWARSAHARLELRTALAALSEASVSTAWGQLAAHSTSELEPRLYINADLDFYDAPALCVRVRTDDHYHSYNVTLTSELGSTQRRVRRTRAQRWTWAGRTLALGAPNDATCRDMGVARD